MAGQAASRFIVRVCCPSRRCDTDSDIDLFLVRSARHAEDDPQWRSQLEVLTGSVQRWTGNRLGTSRSLSVMSAACEGSGLPLSGLAGEPIERVLGRVD